MVTRSFHLSRFSSRLLSFSPRPSFSLSYFPPLPPSIPPSLYLIISSFSSNLSFFAFSLSFSLPPSFSPPLSLSLSLSSLPSELYYPLPQSHADCSRSSFLPFFLASKVSRLVVWVGQKMKGMKWPQACRQGCQFKLNVVFTTVLRKYVYMHMSTLLFLWRLRAGFLHPHSRTRVSLRSGTERRNFSLSGTTLSPLPGLDGERGERECGRNFSFCALHGPRYQTLYFPFLSLYFMSKAGCIYYTYTKSSLQLCLYWPLPQIWRNVTS